MHLGIETTFICLEGPGVPNRFLSQTKPKLRYLGIINNMVRPFLVAERRNPKFLFVVKLLDIFIFCEIY